MLILDSPRNRLERKRPEQVGEDLEAAAAGSRGVEGPGLERVTLGEVVGCGWWLLSWGGAGGAVVEAPPAPCLAQLWLAAVGVEYGSAEHRTLGRQQDSSMRGWARSAGVAQGWRRGVSSDGSRRWQGMRWGQRRQLWKQGLGGQVERGRAAC